MWCTVRQPLRCIRSVVWMSSVTLSVATPADGVQRGDAHRGVGAAPERGAPAVPAREQAPVEQLLLGVHPAVAARGVLEGGGVVELLRALHHGDVGVGEVRQQRLEEPLAHHVVGVDDGHHVGVHLGQRLVDVAGLGVTAAGPGPVAGARAPRPSRGPRPGRRRPGPRSRAGGARADGRGHGRQQDRARLVVRRHEHGDAQGARRPRRPRRRGRAPGRTSTSHRSWVNRARPSRACTSSRTSGTASQGVGPVDGQQHRATAGSPRRRPGRARPGPGPCGGGAPTPRGARRRRRDGAGGGRPGPRGSGCGRTGQRRARSPVRSRSRRRRTPGPVTTTARSAVVRSGDPAGPVGRPDDRGNAVGTLHRGRTTVSRRTMSITFYKVRRSMYKPLSGCLR